MFQCREIKLQIAHTQIKVLLKKRIKKRSIQQVGKNEHLDLERIKKKNAYIYKKKGQMWQLT